MTQTWKALAEELTAGERLELVRRRARWTQAEAADHYGVTTYIYRRWEQDRHRTPTWIDLWSPARDYELCYVRRRRAGLTLHDLGERMGLSHKWIHRAERGEVRDVSALVLWWERHEATA